MKGTKPALSADSNPVKAQPPPKWMSPEAKKEWRRVMPELVARKILTTVDLGTLENYCISQGTVRDMNVTLQRDGQTFVTDNGMIKRHPAGTIQSDAINRARLLAAELGLTPVSRNRPSIRDDANQDDKPSPLDY